MSQQTPSENHNDENLTIDMAASQHEQDTADANAGLDANTATDTDTSSSLLQERIAELEGQLQDEQLRSAAAEQNLRRRHQEELQSAHKFASQKFAAEMLPVKDYLEMALQDQSGNFEALKMGVQMTLNELQKAFEHTQIHEINPQSGDALDPHLHQALQTEVSEQAPNSIVRVLKKGYTLSERVLRPAMVVVAKAAE